MMGLNSLVVAVSLESVYTLRSPSPPWP